MPTVTFYGFFKDVLHVSTGVVRNLVKTKVPRRLRHSVHTIAILQYSLTSQHQLKVQESPDSLV